MCGAIGQTDCEDEDYEGAEGYGYGVGDDGFINKWKTTENPWGFG
jgi:hypothetical protein